MTASDQEEASGSFPCVSRRCSHQETEGEYCSSQSPRSIIALTVVSQNPLIEPRRKNFGIGADIQPPRNLSRFVKWPKYVQLARQKKILNLRYERERALTHQRSDEVIASKCRLLLLRQASRKL